MGFYEIKHKTVSLITFIALLTSLSPGLVLKMVQIKEFKFKLLSLPPLFTRFSFLKLFYVKKKWLGDTGFAKVRCLWL
jgi:hypothetical protein